ncbi:MAG TPA: efflux RND transporter permease subunit [Candidatus Limnocylindrales bacterium]|nr:efflux RND transporter permease subunit [Candidatus Limnocylindrales bacterium]
MMRWLVGWSVKFRLLVIGIAAALLLLGGTQLRQARVDVLPEFTPPYVEVQTEALGLSAEEVEELVTIPLEADLLNGVAFLDEIRSRSITGLSSIVMTFEPGTDIFRARQVVAERLTQAHALPNVSRPPAMLQPLSTENRIMMVGLRSTDRSLIDMSVLARWTIRPRLMGVPGVANVAIWGQRERQLQVLVDPAELNRKGVTLDSIIRTTGNALWVSPLTFLEASTPGTGGFIDTPNQRLGIQHISPIRTSDDLSRVVIVDRDGKASDQRLGDVAAVIEDHQPLIGDAVVGDGQGLMLVIEKFPGVNTLEVTRDVEAALQAMAPGLGGIDVDTTLFRPANFIEASIGNVSLALLIGFVLIALMLGALLFDWRAAAISLVTIPLSIAVAALVLHLSGASINALMLAGLIVAIGVVVDDAAGSVESVLHRFREPQAGDTERSRASLVVEATLEGRRPIVYATLIVLVALVPVFFIGGAASAFLPSLALAYGVAVLASMVVALTLTPALAVLLLSRGSAERHESPILARIRGTYGAGLSSLVQRVPTGMLTGAVALLGIVAIVGVLALPRNGDSVLPSFKAREVLIHWDGAAGTSHPEMARVVTAASQELRTVDGVRNVGGHIGRAILSDAVVGVDSGEIWVTIDSGADYQRTRAAIEDVVNGYPGLGTAVITYPEDRIAEVLSGSDHDVVVRVYGQDATVLGERAEQVRSSLAGVSGIVDPAIDAETQEPAVEIAMDLEAASRHGLKAGDVRRTATTLLSGIEVGLLFEDQKIFEVVVWGTPTLRTSVDTIRDLLIETPDGGLVRLDEVADVSVAPALSVINREGVMRYVDVGAGISGRDVGSVLDDVRAAVASVPFPLEYHAEVFSEAATRQDAQTTLLLVLVGMALLIFLLLQAAFGSWRLAVMVFATLPAALIGGILAGQLAGSLISIGSLAGLFVILAISVRTGVALIDHYQRLERAQGESFGIATILRGAQDRLGPTLITALGTALGVLPFLVLGDVAGLEIIRPMAIFVLGGLITSTLLTLLVFPAMYLRSGPSVATDTDALSTEQQPAFEPTTA